MAYRAPVTQVEMRLPGKQSSARLPLILLIVGGLIIAVSLWQMGPAFPEALNRHSWQYRDNLPWVYLFVTGLAGIGGGLILAIRGINQDRQTRKSK